MLARGYAAARLYAMLQCDAMLCYADARYAASNGHVVMSRLIVLSLVFMIRPRHTSSFVMLALGALVIKAKSTVHMLVTCPLAEHL